jgi:serine/threonine protein kinase/Flp pilus assembly protein TadD
LATKCPKCHSENPDTLKFCGECGTPLLSPTGPQFSKTMTLEAKADALSRGQVIAGRYEVLEPLGAGGMGAVYRVYDRKLEEEVALKLIRPEVAADRKAIERFQNEIKISRKITHKNVCRMHDLGETEGSSFITMEYVRGEDLKSLLHRTKTLPVGTALSIARQVAEGLGEAHGMGVVHRDLKPANIMIDKDGNAKIMDFGIARSLLGQGLTGEGTIIGTPEYMSPEQVEGKTADARSDLYALGIIIFEMVTGQTPFAGGSALSIAHKHRYEPPPDPRKLNSQIPAELSLLILRCLEKGLDKRFQSAEDFLSDLSRAERAIPTAERAAPPKKSLTSREVTVKFGVRKALLWAASLLALVVLAAVLWRLLGRGKPPAIPAGPPSLAVMYFNNNTGNPELDYLRTMLADAFTADLNQSRFIEVLSRETLVQILRDMDQLDARSFSSDVLTRVASQGRVNHLLVGDYAKAGDVIRIHVALQDAASGKTVASELAEGKGVDSIFGLVDELTKKVRADLNLSAKQLSSDIDKNVGQITTQNLEAYKYYLEGIRSHDRNESRQAIALYEQALKLDPEFVMAYRAMAMSYSNLGLAETAKKYLEKALEFQDRFSDRERYQVAGDIYFNSERTYPQAIEMYGKLLELYPQARSANHQVGNIYYFIEEWDNAIRYYEAAVNNKTTFYGSYEYLSIAYRAKGMFDQALEALQTYIKNVGDDAIIHFALAHYDICRGEFDEANRELDKALSLNPTHFYNSYYRGVTALFLEKWENAESEFGKILGEKEPEAWYRGGYGVYALSLLRGKAGAAAAIAAGSVENCREIGVKWAESECHNVLSYADLLSGKTDEATREAEAARTCAAEADRPELERAALHYRGLAEAAKKSLGEARRTADELKRRVDASIYKKDIRRYEHLVGMIALGEGRPREAVSHFERAVSELAFPSSLYTDDHLILDAFYFEPLAEAYYLSGDLDSARRTYEKITGLTIGRYLYGDRYARSFYRLGLIAEKQGDEIRAANHYRKFLDLWKDADPGLPEVEDARKRLAGLKGA